MVRMSHAIYLTYCILFMGFVMLLLPGSSYADEVKVQVSPQQVVVGEGFQIKFISSNSDDSEPDFSPLEKDFDISGTSKSSSISIINSKMTQSTNWTLTAFAKSAGQLVIPAIQFGQSQSQAKVLTVQKSTSAIDKPSNDLFVEVTASANSVYVQAEIQLTVKVYRLGRFANNHRITDLLFSTDHIVVEQISSYQEAYETKNGKQYKTFVGKFVAYPQKSGQFKLNPVVYSAKEIVGQRRSNSFFNPMQVVTKPRRSQSNIIKFEALPIPKIAVGKPWIPASNLTVIEAWSQEPPVFTQGVSTTRTITLAATGLTGSQIPDLQLQHPDTIKQYPDSPVTENQIIGEGVLGTRQEKIALVPTQSGRVVLPALHIPWWNTNKNKFEVATVAAREIDVFTGQAVSNVATPSPVKQPDVVATLPPVELPGDKQIDESHDQSLIWQIISATLLLLWVMTLIAWRFVKIDNKPALVNKPQHISLNSIRASLAKNQLTEIQSIIVQWAKQQFPDHRINNLQDVARYLDSDCQNELALLTKSMYQNDAGDWQRGEALFQALKKWGSNNRATATKASALASL
jgi:hypothetical protein